MSRVVVTGFDQKTAENVVIEYPQSTCFDTGDKGELFLYVGQNERKSQQANVVYADRLWLKAEVVSEPLTTLTEEEKKAECKRICGARGERGIHSIAPDICPYAEE